MFHVKHTVRRCTPHEACCPYNSAAAAPSAGNQPATLRPFVLSLPKDLLMVRAAMFHVKHSRHRRHVS